MKRTVLVVAGVILLVGSAAARAHHSYADFFDHTVSVEGTLEKIEFASPHTVLTMRAKDGAVYTANWRAAFQLERMGVSRSVLKVGDLVVVSGTPSKDPVAHQLARLSGVVRVSDGWAWRLENGRASVTASR